MLHQDENCAAIFGRTLVTAMFTVLNLVSLPLRIVAWQDHEVGRAFARRHTK